MKNKVRLIFSISGNLVQSSLSIIIISSSY